MKISKIHQRFSERLNNPETLTDPEKYLGPNYQDVLNFWIYLDTLSDPEKKEMNVRYWALDDAVRVAAIASSRNAAWDVVGWDFQYAAWGAAVNVTKREVFGVVTCELIGSHKLLEQDKTPTILPVCIKP